MFCAVDTSNSELLKEVPPGAGDGCGLKVKRLDRLTILKYMMYIRYLLFNTLKLSNSGRVSI